MPHGNGMPYSVLMRLDELSRHLLTIEITMYPPHNATQLMEMYTRSGDILQDGLGWFENNDGFSEMDIQIMVSVVVKFIVNIAIYDDLR